jgi:hypothetical protein
MPSDVLIYDHCGNAMTLFLATRRAKIARIAAPSPVSTRPYCEEVDLQHPANPGRAGTFDYLGHKRIASVDVRGERTTNYSSVEAELAGAPPVHVYGSWCSIALDSSLGSCALSDKPKREITVVVSAIRLGEPDPALFEIPPGYTVTKEAGDGAAGICPPVAQQNSS